MRSVLNGIITCCVGGYCEKPVDGTTITERKYSVACSTAIATPTTTGETDTLNWLLA